MAEMRSNRVYFVSPAVGLQREQVLNAYGRTSACVLRCGHAQHRTSLVYAPEHAYRLQIGATPRAGWPWEFWGTMMLGRTAVLLLHAAAAFQFHENKCEPKTSLPTSEDSKRIAFILRGDAYRGLSYGSTARGSKRGFMCTPFAVRIQRAISQSHVDYIIAPLEAAGFVVDVFFATYPCATDGEAQLERLKGFYNRNRDSRRPRR